jgi:hypothetical protein
MKASQFYVVRLQAPFELLSLPGRETIRKSAILQPALTQAS